MESIKELKYICQRNKLKNRGFLLAVGYILHRKISIYITKFLLIVFPRIKPNQVSLLMIVVSLMGISMLAYNEIILNILGIIIVYFGFLLDKCDGEIARYKKMSTLRGVYLDELYHLIIPNLLIISFLSFVFYEISILSFILVILMLLNIINRINRKIQYFIFVKKEAPYRKGQIKKYNGNKAINRIFNNFFFKIFSIVERLDILIIIIFVVILIEVDIDLPFRLYFLYSYFIASFIYFIRWSVLYYFGGTDRVFNELMNNGY